METVQKKAETNVGTFILFLSGLFFNRLKPEINVNNT